MKTVRRLTFSCLTTVCVFSLACSAQADDAWMETVRLEHPRMFFTTNTWPQIQAQAEGSAKSEYVRLLSRVDSYPTNPVCSGMDPVPTKDYVRPDGSIYSVGHTPIPPIKEWGLQASECALAWWFTQKPEYLEKAKRMLAVSAAAYNEADRNHRTVNWYSTSRILWLAAYDWIYPVLTVEERRALLLPMIAHVKLNQDQKYLIVRRNGGSGRATGCYGVRSLQWYAGLAGWKDGICDADAAELLRAGYKEMTSMCEFRNEGAGDDGGLSSAVPGYSLGAYPWAQFNFFHTYLSATGTNIAERYRGLGYHANWIYWMWIQDTDPANPFFCGFGDCRHVENRLLSGSIYEHLTQYMHFYRTADRDAAALAKALRARVQVRPLGTTFPFYPFILSDAADVKPLSDDTLENFPVKARHFENLGEIVMRSGWTSHSTYAVFTAGAKLTMHKHHDENNFVIFKNDFLALDSGSRAVQNDYNLKHYYAQTVAHNCVLIHKPGEKQPSYWGPNCKEDAGKWNDGGQYGVSANVLAFETTPRYSYVASDATKSYGEKSTEAVRQFIHLQPDFFVIYDRVGAADASYAKEWLLHTVNEPMIDGRTMRADSRKGRLFCETILPADAQIRTRGGDGQEFWSNGRNWELNKMFVQKVEAQCAKSGRGPYYGAWRLEVAPAAPAKNDRFLHVLTATDSATGTAVPTKSVSTETQDGVTLTLPCGETVTVLFNRTGPVGGEIRFGNTVRPLATTVQPQAGIFPR